MDMFDFSELNKNSEEFFGKNTYKWLNRTIQAIAIVGLIGTVAAYYLGITPDVNIVSVGFLIFFVLAAAIIIAVLFRGALNYKNSLARN